MDLEDEIKQALSVVELILKNCLTKSMVMTHRENQHQVQPLNQDSHKNLKMHLKKCLKTKKSNLMATSTNWLKEQTVQFTREQITKSSEEIDFVMEAYRKPKMTKKAIRTQSSFRLQQNI